MARKYHNEMLPRAQQAYELYLKRYQEMAAAHPQVLIAQRTFFQLQEKYVAALVSTWQSAVEIQGLLLTGGTEFSATPSPRSADSMRSRGGELEQ